jgi:hypothetical protein
VPPPDAASLGVVTDRADQRDLQDGAEEAEVVDAVPVPEGPQARPIEPAASPRGGLVVASPVAVQAAAVAVTGFAAGAATVAVVRRRRARKRRGLSRRKQRQALGEVRMTRSFLVDIHLLGGRD